MTTLRFTFKLIKEIIYKDVSIMLFNSTNGWFIETSQGLVTEYMKTKKEAIAEIANIKNNIKSELQN